MIVKHSKAPVCIAATVDLESHHLHRASRMPPGDEDVGGVVRQPAAVDSAGEPVTGVHDMFAVVRGNIVLILLAVLLSLGAGTAYLILAPPRYIAGAVLLIDPAASSMPEEYYIESQIQTIRSDPIIRSAIEQLNLVEAGIEHDDSAFLLDRVRAAKRFVRQFVPSFASDPENTDPMQDAASVLRRNLTITRPAMTPVISIAYNSTDPSRAADIVNTLIQVYMEQRRRDATMASRQSVQWLAERLDDLRQKLDDAEYTAENFKTDNNILGTGANHSVRAEQRVYELSMQIEAARNAVDRAKARRAGAVSETAPGVPLRQVPKDSEIAMLADGLPTTVPQGTGLRPDSETDSPRQISPTAGLFGPHASNVDEGQQIADTETEELAGPLRNLTTLDEAFQEASRQAGQAKRQMARLRELEVSAGIYRTLYGNMLQRYQEAVQQSSFPVNDGARILIAARAPDGKSHPRPLLVFAFASAAGIALGVGAAVFRVRQ